MKIEEATEYMSTMYLERVLRSYNNDYPKKGEKEYRRLINNDIDTLSDPKLIKERLDKYFFENKDPYSKQILSNFILRSLLSKSHYYTTSETIVDDVRNTERNIIKASKKSESFKHIDQESQNILSAILQVALEDQVISKDELNLIIKLRKKLTLNENDQYLIQAKLNLFPSKKNDIHTRNEVASVIDDLQKCGVIFYCNKHRDIKENIYVIPEEIVPGVKESLGIELISDKYIKLLNELQNSQLRMVLESTNFTQGGVKEELVNRIIQAGIKPSEVLNLLSVKELADLCDSLPIIKSGLKEEKVSRIIDYYSNLVVKSIDKDKDPREKYYEYLEELASQDLKNLLGNKIISKSSQIETGFEKGTRYLFERKLYHKLANVNGNEKADGYIVFENTGDLLLWDNKSKLDGKPYNFPDSHFRQFRRYIRNESAKGKRVSVFLIITAEISSEAENNAVRLKAESNQDTDVALITAENLKMVAEEWNNNSQNKPINLHLFNHTGVLDRETLKNRLKIFKK